ncbi:unnamed protein product [Paramecium sonneborni]|uniref:OTU domain-containing protein n=1 Tax=Paramecium sonneborni TaxID=65129 RepID=A0A8S1R9G6_9CILI|nr:unnamed protein product [Paramecium sonneborni]
MEFYYWIVIIVCVFVGVGLVVWLCLSNRNSQNDSAQELLNQNSQQSNNNKLKEQKPDNNRNNQNWRDNSPYQSNKEVNQLNQKQQTNSSRNDSVHNSNSIKSQDDQNQSGQKRDSSLKNDQKVNQQKSVELTKDEKQQNYQTKSPQRPIRQQNIQINIENQSQTNKDSYIINFGQDKQQQQNQQQWDLATQQKSFQSQKIELETKIDEQNNFDNSNLQLRHDQKGYKPDSINSEISPKAIINPSPIITPLHFIPPLPGHYNIRYITQNNQQSQEISPQQIQIEETLPTYSKEKHLNQYLDEIKQNTSEQEYKQEKVQQLRLDQKGCKPDSIVIHSKISPKPNPPPPITPFPSSIRKIIYELYEISSQQRQIEDQFKYYVRQKQDQSGLKKNYNLSLAGSKKLGQYCNKFREVRGDGNCFYTAFGYQFLSILLFEYSYNQFQQFMEKIKQIQLPMKIFVTGKYFKIDDKQIEQELLFALINRLIELKKIEDLNQRFEQFHTQFSAYQYQSEEVDGCLYGLSTIFFRNYSNQVVDFSENKDAVYDRVNLLNWEEECNSNEVVIAELAKQLNILVQLLLIENKDSIMFNKYGNEENNKIILLIKPGHYNIGYLIQDNQQAQEISFQQIQIEETLPTYSKEKHLNQYLDEIKQNTSEQEYKQEKVQQLRLDQKGCKPDSIVIHSKISPKPNPPPPITPFPSSIRKIIYELYEISSQQRQIEDQFKYYVRQKQDQSGLKKNYNLSLAGSKKLGQYCNKFREVRGDGNCFYTAFGYQFLSILLFEYSYNQFQQFMEKIKQIQLPMKIFVTGKYFKIDDKQIEQELLFALINRLIELKKIEDLNQRFEQFHTQFSAYQYQSEEVDGCLYGLSTIFFRNYSNQVVDFSENKDAVYDRVNLLNWEEECNSNEVVIAELAKQLNILVQLLLIENKDSIMFNKYGNEENNKIILLIKPGHYNIGYLIQDNQQAQEISFQQIQIEETLPTYSKEKHLNQYLDEIKQNTSEQEYKQEKVQQLRLDQKGCKPDSIVIHSKISPKPNPPPPITPFPSSIRKIIYELYEISSQQRQIEDQFKYYVRQKQDQSGLKKNYNLSLAGSKKLGQYCNKFREVRGDGNCFYTAFGYQFLSILLFEYSYNQFQQFMEKIKQIQLPMKIFVTGKYFKIDDKQIEQELLFALINRLIELKKIEDLNQRFEQFHTQFSAYQYQSEEVDGCLYGLSTIFFRNYSNQVVDFSENKDAVYDRVNLLNWEEECNSNEVVIAELAKQLNILVQLLLIENKDSIMFNKYGNEENNKIILLIKPGHYNIGYLIQDNQQAQEISFQQIQIEETLPTYSKEKHLNQYLDEIKQNTSEQEYKQEKVQQLRLDQKGCKPDSIVIHSKISPKPNPPPPITPFPSSIRKIIYELYEISSQQRQIEDQFKYYVRQKQDQSGLKKNYNLSLAGSKKLGQYCNKFREVRGDGNCFYTAFGYQFLSILLFEYSYNQFQQFMEKIKQIQLPMKIFVTGKYFKIDDKQIEQELLFALINRLIELKKIEDLNQRFEQFHTQFSAYQYQSEEVDGCLYGLSTIFFRNYSNQVVDFSENKDAVYDRVNLLNWEEECNSNEVVIAELAKQLNILVQLLLIENKDSIMFNKYGNEENNKIILLIKPGHYNIGYLIKENNYNNNQIKNTQENYTNVENRQEI